MKRCLVYMMVAMTMLCGCDPMGDKIELVLVNENQAEIKCSCEAQNISVSFDCNRSWTVSTSAEWLNVDQVKGSQGEGQRLKIAVAENTAFSSRIGDVIITAGDRSLAVTITQEKVIKYLINENFDSSDLLLEESLPNGWSDIDDDGDGYYWRRWRDPETDKTYAYSASFDEDRELGLNPDNWMVTPRFVLRGEGFSVKWDVKSGDSAYPGDKYQVWVATYENGGNLVLYQKICEEVTTSATALTHHEYNLDLYTDLVICIAFRHYDSYDLSRVLITNVEVSNR